MKWNELMRGEGAPITDLNEICLWLSKYNKGGHFGGNAGSYGVQIGCAINLSFNDLSNVPIKITTASSSYIVCHNKLATLEDCSLPRNAVHIDISYNPIKSLVGISDIVKTCGSSGGSYQNNGVFDISGCPIQEGGIGLLLIKELREIKFMSMQSSRAMRAFTIISKYLSKAPLYNKQGQRIVGRDAQQHIFECQTELIDMGLEEFAEH